MIKFKRLFNINISGLFDSKNYSITFFWKIQFKNCNQAVINSTKYSFIYKTKILPSPMATLLTLLTLLKGLTLHAIALCMNTLSYFDCLDHQELENIAHNGRGNLMEIERVGWDGTD